MDVFALRDRLVADYSEFTQSFLEVRDPAIRNFVQGLLDEVLLWPDPLVQLNPAFEPGGYIDDLVKGARYEAAVRERLDVNQLPKPFQINALASREWQLSSDWHRFEFTP